MIKRWQQQMQIGLLETSLPSDLFSKDEPVLDQPQSVFDVPQDSSDMTLTVQGRQLHINKSILSNASPVFKRMFEGDFEEKNSTVIPLPEKSYEDIVEMLSCIYPSQMKDVTREKVDILLKLADEYQMDGLRGRCESFLLIHFENMVLKKSLFVNEIVHFMYLADKYSLKKFAEAVTDVAAQRAYKLLFYEHNLLGGTSNNQLMTNSSEFSLISEKTTNLYLSKRVYYLEQKVNQLR